MCRRFITIFALHFFLSVSAFAFGSMHNAAAPQAQAVSSVQAAIGGPEAGALQAKALAESVLNHVLADTVPDLPDSLPRILLAQRPPVDSAPSIGYRPRAVLPPSLDGLLRPPQQAPLSA